MTDEATEAPPSKSEWALAVEGYIDELFGEIEALQERVKQLEARWSKTSGV